MYVCMYVCMSSNTVDLDTCNSRNLGEDSNYACIYVCMYEGPFRYTVSAYVLLHLRTYCMCTIILYISKEPASQFEVVVLSVEDVARSLREAFLACKDFNNDVQVRLHACVICVYVCTVNFLSKRMYVCMYACIEDLQYQISLPPIFSTHLYQCMLYMYVCTYVCMYVCIYRMYVRSTATNKT